MKKNLLLGMLCALLISSAAAQARDDGSYVGGDVIISRPDFNGSDDNDFASGLGVNAGYRMHMKGDLDYLYLAPEAFFDYMDIGNQGNDFNFGARYGAKLNLGYDFDKNISGYLTYGLANTHYELDGVNDNKRRFGSIYGFGFLFHLEKNWDVKGEYTQQRFDTPYNTGRVRLDTVKVGLVYNF